MKALLDLLDLDRRYLRVLDTRDEIDVKHSVLDRGLQSSHLGRGDWGLVVLDALDALELDVESPLAPLAVPNLRKVEPHAIPSRWERNAVARRLHLVRRAPALGLVERVVVRERDVAVEGCGAVHVQVAACKEAVAAPGDAFRARVVAP